MLVESLRNARDPRSVFDSFAYDFVEFAGGIGYTGPIDGEQAIVFACLDDQTELTDDDVSVTIESVEPTDLPTLLAAAEAVALERSCTPGLMAPFECLGTESDPAACSE